MISDISRIIQEAIPDATIEVRDPFNDGAHFEATVISPSFEGLPLIKQHRMVMGALKEALAEDVHAMALKTYTPAKWQAQNGE
jgi:stress-induced morphogen